MEVTVQSSDKGEEYVKVNTLTHGKPDLWVISLSLSVPDLRPVYAWNLSIVLDLEQISPEGLPGIQEQLVLKSIEETFILNLSRDGTALYVASSTWNQSRELIYLIRDAEAAQENLRRIVEANAIARRYTFSIDHDPDWTHVEKYIRATGQRMFLDRKAELGAYTELCRSRCDD